MKITFILPSGFGLSGGERAVAVYADRLQRRGHAVLVVARPPRRPTLREQFRSLRRGRGWLRPPAPGPSHFDALAIPRRQLDRHRSVEDGDVPDADVIIATWWETAEWVASLSPRKGAKVYFVQGHEVFDYVHRDRVAATYHLPLHKIVVARWLADLMATHYGDKNVSLVQYGVDSQQFYAPPRGKNPIPTVGMLYSTTPWKGCAVSLAAFALAARRVPGLRLVSFGAERPSPDLPLPPQAVYHYQPAQSALRDIYAMCDVWLCGSVSEGFHLPPMEAMACRCPVVSTRVGGPQDIVAVGVNGYLAPVGDAATLAEGLVRVLSLSDAEWRAMSEAAYQVSTRYSWDNAVTAFEAALELAIAARR